MVRGIEVGTIESPTSHIAEYFYRERNRQRLSRRIVADAMNEYFAKKYPSDYDTLAVTKDTIGCYENARPDGNHKPNKMRKSIPLEIVQGYCHVLTVPISEVFPPEFAPGAATLDPLAHPEYSKKVLKILSSRSEKMGKLVGWGEYLPCTLETPDFMERHHAAFFRNEVHFVGDGRNKLVSLYNEIGRRRRKGYLAQNPRPKFIHIMFSSDFQNIVDGIGDYEFIDQQMRLGCLANLRKLVLEPDPTISIVIVEDDEGLRRSVRAADCYVVLDANFTFWRHHNGTLEYSNRDQDVRANSARLEKLLRSPNAVTGRQFVDKLDSILGNQFTDRVSD